MGNLWADQQRRELEDVAGLMILLPIMMMFASTFFPLI